MGAVLDVQGGGCRALTLQDKKVLQGWKSKPNSGCKIVAVWAVFWSPARAATPVLWVHQGVRFPVVLGAAGVCFGPGRALQFWGSAVRFGKRNPTGFCKQDGLCAPEECNQEIFPKLLGFRRKVISSSGLVSAFQIYMIHPARPRGDGFISRAIS